MLAWLLAALDGVDHQFDLLEELCVIRTLVIRRHALVGRGESPLNISLPALQCRKLLPTREANLLLDVRRPIEDSLGEMRMISDMVLSSVHSGALKGHS